MKQMIKILPLCLLIIFTGCLITSIHPFFTEDVLVFDPSLVGEWIGEEENENFIFIKNGEKQYKMLLNEETDTTEFTVHLIKLQNHLFLDLYPHSSEKEDETLYQMHYIPFHSIVLLKQSDSTLQLSSLNHSWMKDQIHSDPTCIAHQMIDDRITLTASSKELQQFLINHVQTEGAFEPINTFTRKTDKKSE